jgi:Flp pilus assembly protein TadD
MLSAFAALVLAVATFARNQDYRTEAALWGDTASKSPRKARAFNNLGYAYQGEGRRDEACAAYAQALRLDAGQLRAGVNYRELRCSPDPRAPGVAPGTPR